MITRTVPVIYETDQLGCFNGNFKSYRRDNCTDGTSENSTNSWASAANTITEQISEQELSSLAIRQ